jgi:hypothetical protein
MWILGKLKKKEPLEDFRTVYIRYNKIALTINSCQNMEQLLACERMVSNFELWCVKSNVPTEAYSILIKFLEEKIDNKVIRLT